MGKVNKKPFKEFKAGKEPSKELAVDLLKMIGVGIAGGAALIGSAKKVGDKIKK